MDTSLSGSKAHFEQRPLKYKYHLRITSSIVVAMILRISGTYIPNDLSPIIEYLFILVSCSGNWCKKKKRRERVKRVLCSKGKMIYTVHIARTSWPKKAEATSPWQRTPADNVLCVTLPLSVIYLSEERERDRQTDRQTDIDRDRKRDRKRDRQTERQSQSTDSRSVSN